MAGILTVRKGADTLCLPFDGEPRVDEVLSTAGLSLPHPCGGRGVCGKCRIRIEGALSPLTEEEKRFGCRLSCRTRLLGDAVLTLTEKGKMEIETSFATVSSGFSPMRGKNGAEVSLGAAVDIGTTTVVLLLTDMKDGTVLAETSAENPQTSVAADVMGRIGAAKDGRLAFLSSQIRDCIRSLTAEALRSAGRKGETVGRYVLTGNTTMLYLLIGRDPDCLSHAPFSADTLFDTEWELDGIPAYLPPCMSAFVGADISCAVLASGMTDRAETSLLTDIGTNGEIALYKNGTLFVSSTAAGPAFEGAGISCGCAGIPGAVDRVTLVDGVLRAHTIGDLPPVGICGSGLIDAVACYLDAEIVDETGSIDGETLLAPGVEPVQKDIRAVQLAKAAIAAGIGTLLTVSGTKEEEIRVLYIAGGFGNHLDIRSAVRIGLIPSSLGKCARPIGNASLAGAAALLRDTSLLPVIRSFTASAETVNLGGDPRFNENYMEQMLFPWDE